MRHTRKLLYLRWVQPSMYMSILYTFQFIYTDTVYRRWVGRSICLSILYLSVRMPKCKRAGSMLALWRSRPSGTQTSHGHRLQANRTFGLICSVFHAMAMTTQSLRLKYYKGYYTGQQIILLYIKNEIIEKTSSFQTILSITSNKKHTSLCEIKYK